MPISQKVMLDRLLALCNNQITKSDSDITVYVSNEKFRPNGIVKICWQFRNVLDTPLRPQTVCEAEKPWKGSNVYGHTGAIALPQYLAV